MGGESRRDDAPPAGLAHLAKVFAHAAVAARIPVLFLMRRPAVSRDPAALAANHLVAREVTPLADLAAEGEELGVHGRAGRHLLRRTHPLASGKDVLM